jgi:hypothetical protein
MTLALQRKDLARTISRQRIHSSVFDNWYVHCPKCGGLLIQRMGSGGPAWVCLCARRREGAEGRADTRQ